MISALGCLVEDRELAGSSTFWSITIIVGSALPKDEPEAHRQVGLARIAPTVGHGRSRNRVECPWRWRGDPHEQTRFASRLADRCCRGSMLGVWLVGLAVILGRSVERIRSWCRPRPRPAAPRRPACSTGQGRPAAPVGLDDPRLSSLRQAADSWRQSTGPAAGRRRPGLPGARCAHFLEAIAAWDERTLLPDPDRRAGLDIAVPAGVSSGAGRAICPGRKRRRGRIR